MTWERIDAGWFAHDCLGSIHRRGDKRWWWYPPDGQMQGPFRTLAQAKRYAKEKIGEDVAPEVKVDYVELDPVS